MTIFAPAPSWMRPEMLGTPLDAHFQTVQSGGTSIFPGAPITGWQADDFHHGKLEVDDSMSFDANLSAWTTLVGIKAGMGTANDYRFASYRAWDVHFISAVDDRYPHAAPPPGAVWYPARIYWGHSYEQVCFGDAHTFTSSVAAKFKVLDGDVDNFARSNDLQCQLSGRGLTPTKPGAIFAGSDQDVRRYYTDSGPIAPVFVEYRLIPGIAPPPAGMINWLAPYTVTVRFNAIRVGYQVNWFRASWNAQGFCLVNGQPVGPPTPAVNGDKVTDGTQLSVNWVAPLSVAPGDKIACGLQGTFSGMARAGQIARGVMQDTVIRGPGSFSGAFDGSNADTRYTVQYTVSVSPPQ
jgi:hypothetical protein